MAKYQYIELSVEGGVARMVLNRPDLHNAFNDGMISEITQAVTALSEDTHHPTRLLVLEGSGASFCAGADLNWMKRMKDYSEEENFQDSEKLSQMFLVLNSTPFPTLAVLQGHALGGGVGLVASCDYVLASDKAQLALTEVRLGLVPAVISPFVVAKMGESGARAFFLSGSRMDAARAQALGLVHEVVAPERLDERKKQLIQTFLETAPLASRECKRLIQSVLEAPRDTASQNRLRTQTCHTIARLRTQAEGQEGMGALLEKRAPAWMPPKPAPNK